MRATANERGTWETGFRRPDEGWHIGKFLEGIDYLKTKKDGEETVSANKQGDKNWKFPMVIEDEDDDNNGIKHDLILAENNRGTQMVADVLGASGLYPKFEKKFAPKDVGKEPEDKEGFEMFDPEVIKLIMTQLPNQFWRFKVKHVANKKDPEQPYINIVGFGKVSDTIASLDAALFPDKKGKAAGKSAGKAADKPGVVEDDPFA
jgi:hypothetical protein